MLENSVKSSACFDLSHGSFYDIDAASLEDSEGSRPARNTKAILQHFASLSLICDFCFLMTAFSFSPLFFGMLPNAPISFNYMIGSLVLTSFSLVVFYLSKLYRIETIANFRFFCARFSVILLSVLAAAEIENFMVSPGAVHAAAFDRPLAAWGGPYILLIFGIALRIMWNFPAVGHARICQP